MVTLLYNIPDFPGYKITKAGKVWSKIGSGRFLKPGLTGNGYSIVGLYKNKRRHIRTLHRLVLETFISPRPNEMECRHLDGNKQNNALNNLCRGTGIENQADRVKHKTDNRGENSPNTSLSVNQVREIRMLLSRGILTQEKIGRIFNIAQSTVSRIKLKLVWKYV